MTESTRTNGPRFQFILIKPSHYDKDGYVVQWMRSTMPSNSLAAVYGLAQGAADGFRGRAIWLQFATWILLALEFALAADIVRTAVAPTWDDIWKLAVIAVVRTMLNYFLARDIADFSRLEESQPNKSLKNQSAGPASP